MEATLVTTIVEGPARLRVHGRRRRRVLQKAARHLAELRLALEALLTGASEAWGGRYAGTLSLPTSPTYPPFGSRRELRANPHYAALMEETGLAADCEYPGHYADVAGTLDDLRALWAGEYEDTAIRPLPSLPGRCVVVAGGDTDGTAPETDGYMILDAALATGVAQALGVR